MTKAELRTIVLIDDEPDIRTIGRLSLERVGGWTVHAAASGTQGIAAAREHRPELILLDVMMPGLDGPGTLAQLQADPDLRKIPVVFMTAKVQRDEVDHYLRLGVAGVIPKPFDPMTLPQQVRDIFGGER
jgi:two-component system, OmpR family, response regulator